ncbi:MAG TPA: histidine phosphatase family protein [Anaerolineae bacterium]|nr:histidine phosphatase family protein [Anaerolineae bacterium]HOU24838.1 histidine phosphatase family protein [Anaerolineae bacterium]HQJ50613.1 histidine phosphatase family protein [Anaerolineae bacterium]
MTRIILIRHGQTTWNAEERIRGQVEVPLDSVGISQAQATAARVAREWQPAAVYCSPLQRAVQTAQFIADRVGLDAQVVPELNDMDFGVWQGLTYREVRANWPELARQWMEEPERVSFPGGETLDMVRERGMAALQRIIERHPDQQVVVVGHTVLNRVLLCGVLGLTNAAHWRIGQDTCAVNVIDWQKGTYYLQSLNDICHLRH